MPIRLAILLLLLFAAAFGNLRTIARPAVPFPRSPGTAPPPPLTFAEVRAFLTDHCAKCHGEKAQKGGVNLAPYPDEKALLAQRKTWRAVVQQLATGQMPPEEQKQPTKEQRDRIVEWLTSTLDNADEHDRKQPNPGRTIVRRLTRMEYNRTVRDLLGVEADVASAVGMPDETVGESFDNLAAALNFSDVLMEKYFAAADLIIEKLYAPPAKEPKPKPGGLPPLLARVITKPATGMAATAAARQSIERLARRAYRRGVEPREVERLLGLFEKASRSGVSFEEAFKPVFKALLASPHFLLRVEQNRAKDSEIAYRVSDHELATRLSYFLWSSMPDEELFALAEKNELSKPEVYEKQLRRMLADPKARALLETFGEQWLLLKKLREARPSTEFFPTFNSKLRQAMHDEVATFFDKLREEDRSILELLDADYTYVNADLAKHYGLPDVTGPEMRKVKLTDSNRGGLLGMGAVLAMTSHTNRTSPTLRGKYVLGVILGNPPPPPPPGVSQIDEGKVGKAAKNFREQLALHATQASCAGCHSKIDPLGFGLENFDAVGRYRKSGGDVDATGKLPGGSRFDGPKELKQVLLQQKGRFVENVTEKLLAFALGRELEASDAVFVRAITADLEKNGYRFSALVAGVAKSYPFQYRRNE